MSTAEAQPPASEFIVVVRSGVDVAAFALVIDARDGVEVAQVYTTAIHGLHVELTPAAHASLSRDRAVLFISTNRRFTAAAESLPTGVDRVDAERSSVAVAGRTVTEPVAVLDSGIAPVSDLNVQTGVNCTGAIGTADRYGHGTHVAGIIGAKDDAQGTVGVAPGAPLHPVKVLDDRGAGSDASILCGIEWVTTVGRLLGVRVANMSVTTDGSDDGSCGLRLQDPVHLAICAATEAGTLFVAAAGNGGHSIDFITPAAYDEVLTVTWMNDYDGTPARAPTPAACTQLGPDDSYSNHSNFASDVSEASHVIAAPGSCITSTAVNGGTRVASGSSMAAPHVTGTVALCLEVGACTGTAHDVMQQVRATSAAQPAAYGFTGDPARPAAPDVHYGHLVHAGGY